MAETIVFQIPTYVAFSKTPTGANWYQSDDGEIWDVTPVDTVTLSLLPLDTNGKFIWDSLLASGNRYHTIKFITSTGQETEESLFLPPRPTFIKNAVSGIMISNVESYSLGESIEFILRVDDAGINAIGNFTDVSINDEFGNTITVLQARRIGSIYVASWTAPLNLRDYYNPDNLEEANAERFLLSDNWNLYGNIVSYQFTVNKELESPTSNNSIIYLSIDGIQDSEGNTSGQTHIMFATKLTPFYSSANDVRDVNRGLLGVYNDFTIARQIINYSKIVDVMMRPDRIYYIDTFTHAVRNFVRLKAASSLLLSVAQLNEEEKSIDTFRYRASSARPKDLIDPIEDAANKFALFIYAGGKDTPYISKNFEKGLFDPNRPNLARANFDSSGWFPWLNSTYNSFTINVEGQNMEVRGERGIQYSYIMSRYLNSDLGDVGYLSGI